MLGRVTKRARDSDGNPLGTAHETSILDTRQYIVEFNDGDEAELSANVIANNMYSQCDPDGNQYFLLDSLIDSAVLLLLSVMMTIRSWIMVEHIIAVPLLVGTYVASGRKAQPPVASYQTSRNIIPLRLLNILLPKD